MRAPFVDAHCHLVTNDLGAVGEDGKSDLPCDGTLRCVMSTNPFDWGKLRKIHDSKIFKSFGVHPWYCHLFSLGQEVVCKQEHYRSVLEFREAAEIEKIEKTLPNPIPLESYIAKQYDDDQVYVIGEIGLDKLFRLPENGYYVQTDEPSRLTRVRVKMSHQVAVFNRMCQLAIQYGKPVSIHDVKCHGKLFEILSRVLLPHDDVKVCLHSFTGSVETITHQWLKAFPPNRVFFSLSKFINFKSQVEGRRLAPSIPQTCILTETDFPIDGANRAEIQCQLEFVCEQLTDILGLSNLEQLKSLVFSNFQSFLNHEVRTQDEQTT